MKLADVTAWLTGEHDFHQGAALYATLGSSPVYKRLFALGATEASRPVLLRELRALVDSLPVEVAAVPPSVPPPLAAAPEPAPAPPGPDSPLLTHLHRELKAVRDLRSHTHPQLTAKGMRCTERLKAAATIVALTDKEVELLGAIAYVQQHGRLPGPVSLRDITDPVELQRRLLNLRAQRSKLRKLPERAAELAQAQADIDWILTSLKS